VSQRTNKKEIIMNKTKFNNQFIKKDGIRYILINVYNLKIGSKNFQDMYKILNKLSNKDINKMYLSSLFINKDN
tara:strand:- start:1011 stop:1232 length:222 start_codon:yes stop_codon:yes gene_type:complete